MANCFATIPKVVSRWCKVSFSLPWVVAAGRGVLAMATSINRLCAPIAWPLEANAVQQAFASEEFCSDCGNKAHHGEPAIELFRALMEAPACIGCGVFHLRLTGIDIAVAFAIGRDQSGGRGKR